MITHKLHRYRVVVYMFSNVFRNCTHRRITLPKALLGQSYNSFKREKFAPILGQWLPIFGLICAASPAERENASKKKKIKELLQEADELFNESQYDAICKLLQDYKDSDNVEVLWRLSRALYNQSKEELDLKIRKNLVEEAFHVIESALALDDSNFAVHKWYAVLLDAHASYAGIKARINELPAVKAHMMRASELNPKDATTLYMLGQWCFGIADMPWYQRKIASTLFATPPTSSYEEALKYFVKAEEMEPNFYCLNLLMLGKTYLRLMEKERAIYYLNRVIYYPARTDEDTQAKKEAAEILQSINP